MGKVPKLRFKKISVTWVDAQSLEGWVALDKLPTPPICHTNGYLIKETEEYVIVAGTIGAHDDDTVGDVIVIPRGMIKEIKGAVRKRRSPKAAPATDRTPGSSG